MCGIEHTFTGLETDVKGEIITNRYSPFAVTSVTQTSNIHDTHIPHAIEAE